ncbi:MAG: menaquinone biosynthesis protein [Desulfovermiculus sp.]|nr:menaquinone biosynthesis protein [Desulfovermiculus sp.]
MSHIPTASTPAQAASRPIRVGKISYLNVLPIYYALDHGHVAHNFVFTSGPPAELNARIKAGELDLSAASSIEYARNYQNYRLVPGLAIGSQGPVQSVLLLSQVPLSCLQGESILISSQTHTSAALLRLLVREKMGLKVRYETGDITARLVAKDPPTAFLAIGDEALRLRSHPDFPYSLDLGLAWLEWTGLPFIFGVWIGRKPRHGQEEENLVAGSRQLLASKAWGVRQIPFFARLVSEQGILDYQALVSYFKGLVYDFGPREQAGLRLFYRKLYSCGELPSMPDLRFVSIPSDRE